MNPQITYILIKILNKLMNFFGMTEKVNIKFYVVNLFLKGESMIRVLNFDLSEALTLRGVKFWEINAQPHVRFLMNGTYFSTEFERI